MSYIEYQDLYEKCQDTAPYHMFIYDIKNSKEKIDPYRTDKLWKLVGAIYEEIQKLEQIRNYQILHRHPLFNQNPMIGYLQEPFVGNGDMMSFTVLRNRISNEEINTIFENCRQKLNINDEFHKSDGYYETDLYEEGNEKYCRAYCLQYLSTKHKHKKNNHLK